MATWSFGGRKIEQSDFIFSQIAESWTKSQNQSETQIFCSSPPLIQVLGEGGTHYFFPTVPEKLWIPQGVFLKPFPKLLKITFYIQEFSRDLWILLLIFPLKEHSKFCFLHTCRTLCWVRFKLIKLISTFFMLIFKTLVCSYLKLKWEKKI